MNAGPKVNPKTCPECGAEQSLAGERTNCWLCHHVLSHAELAAEAIASEPVAPSPSHSFSLMTLMLLVTLASVAMGVTAIAPGLGIMLIILLTPALVRTFGIVRRREATGQLTSFADRIGTLYASLGVVIVIAVASVGAFVATCGPIGAVALTGEGEGYFYVAIFVAVIAAGAAGFFTTRALWRSKER